MKIGFWKSQKSTSYMSSIKGLNEEQIRYLQNLKIGDRLVLWVNDVREGEKDANLTLARSTFVAQEAPNALQA